MRAWATDPCSNRGSNLLGDGGNGNEKPSSAKPWALARMVSRMVVILVRPQTSAS